MVIGVANFTRFATAEGGVISVRGRSEIRSTCEQVGQIFSRGGCGLYAHLVFHMASNGLHGGQLGAGRTIQHIFRNATARSGADHAPQPISKSSQSP
jgi:hypothetical protein